MLNFLDVVSLNMVSLNIDAPARLPSKKVLMHNTLISASALTALAQPSYSLATTWHSLV